MHALNIFSLLATLCIIFFYFATNIFFSATILQQQYKSSNSARPALPQHCTLILYFFITIISTQLSSSRVGGNTLASTPYTTVILYIFSNICCDRAWRAVPRLYFTNTLIDRWLVVPNIIYENSMKLVEIDTLHSRYISSPFSRLHFSYHEYRCFLPSSSTVRITTATTTTN